MKNSPTKHRVLIVGAGAAGRELVAAIRRDVKSARVVGFLDDRFPNLKGRTGGIPVRAAIKDLEEVAKKLKVDEVYIAIPSAEGGLIRRFINNCNSAKVTFRIIPRILELIEGHVRIEQVREVRPEDLLGRAIVKADQRILRPVFDNKTILVTGAAGSIGSELCRQLAEYKPKRLITLDWWENGLYDFELGLREKQPKLNLNVHIANIQDEKIVSTLFRRTKPDFVFHAAAYKHVPLMERNPVEALKNNIIGTWNVAKAAKNSGAKKFILISTDKAVRPTSVMGATKAVGELLVEALNCGQTLFSSVRFGNVLASHGSVILAWPRVGPPVPAGPRMPFMLPSLLLSRSITPGSLPSLGFRLQKLAGRLQHRQIQPAPSYSPRNADPYSHSWAPESRRSGRLSNHRALKTTCMTRASGRSRTP